jgi:hypothetical protein
MDSDGLSRIGVTAFRSTSTLILLAVAACSGTMAPEGTPLVRGPIESIAHHATGSGFLVGARPGSREACGISATADDRTRYLRRSASGAYTEAARADLEVGDTVEVFVDGPVAESCPVQGRAAALVLINNVPDAESNPY